MTPIEGALRDATPEPSPDALARYFQDIEDEEEEIALEEQAAAGKAEQLAQAKESRARLMSGLEEQLKNRYFPSTPLDLYGNRKKFREIAEFVASKGVNSSEMADQVIRSLIMQSRSVGGIASVHTPLDRLWLAVRNGFIR